MTWKQKKTKSKNHFIKFKKKRTNFWTKAKKKHEKTKQFFNLPKAKWKQETRENEIAIVREENWAERRGENNDINNSGFFLISFYTGALFN